MILEGLARLEYRGYDSAGLVVTTPAGGAAPRLAAVKRAGKLTALRAALAAGAPPGTTGIGHTRWATHGRPDDANAHPHLSEDGRVGIIHNGIIENHAELRRRLEAAGHAFASETDSEVLVHLIEEHYRGDLPGAVRAALREVRGAYSVVVTHAAHEELVAARSTSPLVIGLGAGENLVASDVTALLPHTRDVIYLQDGDLAVLTPSGARVVGPDGEALSRPAERVEWDAEAAERGGFEHFMLKEIYDQPEVLRRALAAHLTSDGRGVDLGLRLDPTRLDRIVITAAGSAYYAGLTGEYLIERLARLPVEVEIASEFRYREPVLDERTLCIAVSQSGETIDTLEALREAKRRGAPSLGLLNARGTSIEREVDETVYLHAGPEIGVASTKAYLAMVAVLTQLAIYLGRARGTLSDAAAAELVAALQAAPGLVESALATRAAAARIAKEFSDRRAFLFLGRGLDYPTALEGALKLKEITYLHAEAYPSGELKHGPIALVDAELPVVAIATRGPLHSKTLSNLQEVRARNGTIIALACDGDSEIAAHADRVIPVPCAHELTTPLVNAVPLQLLAYETARLLGRDVDRPRNLAKSVTVE